MGATTDPIKAAAAMNFGDAGMSSNQIAPLVGIASRTVREIVSRHGRWGEIAERPVFAQLRHEQKAHLEAASRLVSAKALARVDETIENASAYQAAGIYGLLRTHERLDAGEPTEITASVNVNIEQRVDGLVEALGQALLLKQAEPPAIDVTPGATLGASDNKANDKP